jgi:diketogulonate reductase-like aldo/keto reductase
VVEECGRRQITFLAYSPVGGARLAQRIPQMPILQEIARQHHCSPHAVVLGWVRAKGSTVVPIPGATNPEHAVDSAKSVSVKLSAKEIAAIDAMEFPRT